MILVGCHHLNDVLVEVFADIVCLYVSIKQAYIHGESDNEKQDLKHDQKYCKNEDENNFFNGKYEDEFFYFFYFSLRDLPLPDDNIIFTLKNLKKVLVVIINFQMKNYTVSPANFIPLPAYCMNLMHKKLQEILMESRWK